MEDKAKPDENEPEAYSKDLQEKLVHTSQSGLHIQEDNIAQEHGPAPVSVERSDLPHQSDARSESTQQHVITSSTGRQFVARIYDEGDPVLVGDTDDTAESNMARKLCLNLLTEFVKGQVKEPRSIPVAQKASHEELEQEVTDQRSSAFQENKPSPLIKPQSSMSKDTDMSDDGEMDEPPHKKARFAWQIKKSQQHEPESSGSTENEDKSNEPAPNNDTLECDHNMESDSEYYGSDVSSFSDSEDAPPTVHRSGVQVYKISGPGRKFDDLQRHHIAKSIVDNAINKTLEEMGLSPDQVGNQRREQFRQQRQRIEAVGVAEVIRERGLHGPQTSDFPSLHRPPSDLEHPSTTAAHASLHRHPSDSDEQSAIHSMLRRHPSDVQRQSASHTASRLYPLISRLTEVSENMFVRNNPRGGVHVSASFGLGPVNPSQTANDAQLPETAGNASSRLEPETTEEEREEDNALTTTIGTPSSPSNIDTPSSVTSAENCDSSSESSSESRSSDDITVVKAGSDIEQIEKEQLSSSYILDKALNAAITERGLQY